MKPVLYSETETAFDTNGIGILNDAKSAQVVQELNGVYELTLKYPDTGIHAASIADRCIILAKPDPVTDPQPFRIYRINPVSKGVITAYARHIAHDTMGIPVAPFDAASVADALTTMKANAVVACPFAFTTDKSTVGKITNPVPKSIWALLSMNLTDSISTFIAIGVQTVECLSVTEKTSKHWSRTVTAPNVIQVYTPIGCPPKGSWYSFLRR